MPETNSPAAEADDYLVKVLLVDDQAIVGEKIRRTLAQQPKTEFHYCRDPSEAVNAARTFQPTVILQDLVMPGVDGLTLLREYRANPLTRDIPVIVLSTKEEPVVKSEAFALGASDYLIKLPDAIELIARIRHHSRAYLNQLQRDAAYLALHESQRKLIEINAELKRLTNVDGLTGLSNRRFFNEHMEAQWKLAIREQTPLSILMADLDNFKRYNDTYGHLSGDEVLKGVGAALRESFVRPTDLAARFGGEEFVVVLPATSSASLRQVAERLRGNVEGLQIPHSGSTVSNVVTISIGGATRVPRKDETFIALVEAADAALYRAKEAGKNRVVTEEDDPAAT
jgi:two-component system chemotaxis family response regulator WspR